VLHFGEPLKPITRRQRITVRNDDELANALERVRPFFPGQPVVAIARNLGIKGAVAIEEDDARRSEIDEWWERKGSTRRAAASRSR
jgi:mannose/fructose/N-acetylgalactosamine-specific phosphotransferase system component IID